MLVGVGQNGFSTSVYHKVDDFSFPVVLYNFPGRNVPIKMGYNVFSSQLLRFARICSVKDDFVECAENIFSIMLNKGYLADYLIRSCENVFDSIIMFYLSLVGFHVNKFLLNCISYIHN